jgi:hypothetical protein
MPEVVIKYNSERALNALIELAKYFDFVISFQKTKKKKEILINGVSVIPANSSVNTSAMTKIFTGKNITAKELRARAWQRKK